MTELNISHSDASAAILAHVEAGTLVQGNWHGRASDGREIACLLGAIHPSVESPADCNGELMPLWLAVMTPTLFDGIPAESVLPVARRYGELVARWGKLSRDQWDAILIRVLVRCIDVAMESARAVSEGLSYWPAVAAACDQVKTALVSGDAAASLKAEAAASAAASEAAASAAAGAAARAAEAASAAASEAEAAASAAAAAGAAAWAARAARAARAEETAAGAAARAAEAAEAAAAEAEAAAYLSLFGFVLDQIEMECGQ